MLAIKPCSDGISSNDNATTEVDTTHNHENELDDSCSTLCVCICCGTHIIDEAKASFSLQIPNKTTPLLRTAYISYYRFDFLYNIWQPPQLIS